jgi:hypothetical protein
MNLHLTIRADSRLRHWENRYDKECDDDSGGNGGFCDRNPGTCVLGAVAVVVAGVACFASGACAAAAAGAGVVGATAVGVAQ